MDCSYTSLAFFNPSLVSRLFAPINSPTIAFFYYEVVIFFGPTCSQISMMFYAGKCLSVVDPGLKKKGGWGGGVRRHKGNI